MRFGWKRGFPKRKSDRQHLRAALEDAGAPVVHEGSNPIGEPRTYATWFGTDTRGYEWMITAVRAENDPNLWIIFTGHITDYHLDD